MYPAIFVLCVVAFCINCQPSEPYLTSYLENEKGLSEQQLDDIVWPSNTYASFAFLFPIAIAAELTEYRRVVLVGLGFREATRIVLLYCSGVTAAVTSQITYAAASNVNTVLYSLVYVLVPAEDYAASTSHVQAAYHAGNVLAAGLSQLLVTYARWGDQLYLLFYLSWGFTTLGCLVFVFSWSRFRGHSIGSAARYQEEQDDDVEFLLPGDQDADNEPTSRVHIVKAVISEYQQGLVFVLSLWSVFAFASYFIFGNYYQTLLMAYYGNAVPYGLFEMVYEIGSMCGAHLAQYRYIQNFCQDDKKVFLLMSLSLFIGAFYFILTLHLPHVEEVFLLIVFQALLFGFGFASVSATIANAMKTSYFAVLLGTNAFGSLGLATVISVVLARLDALTEAFVLACALLHALVLVIILMILGAKFLQDRRRRS